MTRCTGGFTWRSPTWRGGRTASSRLESCTERRVCAFVLPSLQKGYCVRPAFVLLCCTAVLCGLVLCFVEGGGALFCGPSLRVLALARPERQRFLARERPVVSGCCMMRRQLEELAAPRGVSLRSCPCPCPCFCSFSCLIGSIRPSCFGDVV